ncbi:MAG: MFS transporter, partial [Candidatus Hodarchaeota archaeon]
MDVFTDFFGITELNYKARNLVWKHLSLFIGVIIIYNLTSSFLFLYIINTIGIQEAGVFLAISIFLSAILDYPSGNLADKIGHKKVLASSYICFFSFFIGLVIARTFADFIILAIIQAVATSQQSGVLPSWLDSNYRHLAEAEDKEFKIYGFYKGRLYTMRSVFLPISVMIGGILADLINRQFVFLVTAISIIVFLIQIILLMRSYFPQSTSPKSSSLRSLFKNGIIFLGKDRKIFFFFSGSILQDVLWLVWFSFAMIITFGYVGTDTLLGITRTIYHISNVIVMLW